ncbi:polyprenol monophosphomannose synthase [bacterium]|nr:polyprenol monophosphomannose synthase [bacterium]
MEQILVIIPTYNEVHNVQKVIPKVLEQDPRIEILVVDDNSPDGTAEAVERWCQKTSRIHLLQRSGKMGLGTAYVEGFKMALQQDYQLVFQMDADLSHDPNEIPNFLKCIGKYDVVIGSRYIQGVNVVNWPISRLLLSWFANLYSRVVTGMSIRDATGGYKCFHRHVLEKMNFNKIHSDGYAFQIEMNFKVWKKGFQVKEIPIVFVDRNDGVSKMHPGIVQEAFWMVWRLRLLSVFGRL